MNIAGRVSFWISVFVFFGDTPGSGTAGAYGRSSFRFWGISILFSIVPAPTYIPTNSALGFPFSNILSFCYF